MKERIGLNNGWKFKAAGKNTRDKISPGKFYPASVPGTIHTDLLDNGLIDDPYFADNEKRLAWIAEQDWIYEKEFSYKKIGDEDIDLVFKGLDTICNVYLNGKIILNAENMFLEYRIDTAKKLIDGKNKIQVELLSPVKYVNEMQDRYGALPVERNPERIYIRKAQYSFGWDWGPVFPTSGIWKNVYLEKIDAARISSFSFETISANKNKAVVEIKVQIEKRRRKKGYVVCEFSDQRTSYEEESKISGDEAFFKFKIKNPNLWNPNGEGEPYLYDLKIRLLDKEKNILDEKNKKAGIRTIELKLKEKGQNVFKLEINGKAIFCKGANWIPSDSFLTRITRENYLKQLRLAKEANMNMIRVWGGGIYECDEFYEECDRLGLMVWHDMMFACAAYPEHKSFIQNVKKEIEQNVSRLQYHPSIVIWCGNNENEWIWYRWQKEQYKKLPGIKIYESVIPKILEELDENRPYWQSSPFGFDNDPNSEKSGNRHQWDIWSVWKDYTEVSEDKSLFVTEFGFQGPANKNTFEKYLPESNRKVNDEVFEFHNKQIEGPERIYRFLAGHLPVNSEWDNYLYLAQLNQAFALKTCLEHWRTNGKTMGTIIWQLNDSYPVTSWSLIDYELKPKIAYHFVKDSFNDYLIYQKQEKAALGFYLFNQKGKVFDANLEIVLIDGSKGIVIHSSNKKIKIKGKQISKIYSPEKVKLLINEDDILILTIKTSDEKILSRNYFTSKRWKYFRLQKPEIEIKQTGDYQITVSSKTPLFFVDFYHPDCAFDKRGIIILPNEKMEINILEVDENINVDEIKVISLNDFLSN